MNPIENTLGFITVACVHGYYTSCDTKGCSCNCHTRREELRIKFEPESSKLRIINYKFTIDELIVLYKLLEHQYIPYDNELAHLTIRKIGKIIDASARELGK